MGLTYLPERKMCSVSTSEKEPVIALAGNPNTGKSTVFNALTGLRQHTGNWPGKTVLQAAGSFIHNGQRYTLIDLPGTYSLLANSVEEQVARDFICFARPDATVVVVDATCLERNLNIVLQVIEITGKVIVCLNLMDEARRKGLTVEMGKLAGFLGVPVVGTAARSGEGLADLLDTVGRVINGKLRPKPNPVKYPREIEEGIARLEPGIREVLGDNINSRWVALRLLEGDRTLAESLEQFAGREKAVFAQEVLA